MDHLQNKVKAIHTRCYKDRAYGYIAGACKGQDKQKNFVELEYKAEICKSTKCCVLCKDIGLQKEDVAHVPCSGWYQVFKEELLKAKSQAP